MKRVPLATAPPKLVSSNGSSGRSVVVTCTLGDECGGSVTESGSSAEFVGGTASRLRAKNKCSEIWYLSFMVPMSGVGDQIKEV